MMPQFNTKDYKVILRGIVGSTAHGLNVSDGLEDRDEMGVCIEPIRAMVGYKPFEQYIYRTAAEREDRHNARSGAGDLDLTVYSLRKYTRLALGGNPTILLLLFTPNPMVITEEGERLRSLAPLIVSKKAGRAFLGYMTSQKRRLAGDQGGKHGAGRPELIERYGYDTKYSGHILRLGLQGIELMKTGSLTLPIPQAEREVILDVRNGKWPLKQVLAHADQVEHDLERALETTELPDEPDHETIEKWMVDVYEKHWTNLKARVLSKLHLLN